MKITYSSNRSIGSVLLAVILVVVTVVFFGYVITKVVTCLKRIDARPDPRFALENETNLTLHLPPHEYVFSISVKSSLAGTITRDVPDEPPVAASRYPSISNAPAWYVETELSGGQIWLAMRNMSELGWIPTPLNSLVPCDEFGIPTLSFSSGELPGVPVSLQTKTNLNGEWQTLMPLRLQPDVPHFHSIKALEEAVRFYRAVQP